MKPAADMRERLQSATAFFHHEAAGGLVLLAAAVAALIVANSPLDWLYGGLLMLAALVRGAWRMAYGAPPTLTA